MFQARQGDVWIEAVDTIPVDANEVSSKSGRVVLAYGEVTGHAHQILVDPTSPHVREYTTTERVERFLRISVAARLQHEEHATITLPPGEYRTFIQREYSPDEIRQVVD